MRIEEGLKPLRADVAGIAQRHPFQCRAHDRIGGGRRLGVAIRKVAGFVEGQRFAQAGEVEAQGCGAINRRTGLLWALAGEAGALGFKKAFEFRRGAIKRLAGPVGEMGGRRAIEARARQIHAGRKGKAKP